MKTVHAKVDLVRWTKLFPLDKLRQEARDFVTARQIENPANYKSPAAIEDHIKLMSPSGKRITSPFSIAIVEQLRAEGLANKKYKTVQTDVMVFAKGEPEKREMTKVGGLPYWPVTKPWPTTTDGSPMTFVGQFCFADSRDLVGDLPGEVLLVFIDGKRMFEDSVRFEWMSLGDWPLIQNDDTSSFGKFLCAFGSIEPTPEKPWPWLNVEAPFDYWAKESKPECDRFLMWGDAGSFYVFIDSNGKLNYSIQCY